MRTVTHTKNSTSTMKKTKKVNIEKLFIDGAMNKWLYERICRIKGVENKYYESNIAFVYLSLISIGMYILYTYIFSTNSLKLFDTIFVLPLTISLIGGIVGGLDTYINKHKISKEYERFVSAFSDKPYLMREAIENPVAAKVQVVFHYLRGLFVDIIRLENEIKNCDIRVEKNLKHWSSSLATLRENFAEKFNIFKDYGLTHDTWEPYVKAAEESVKANSKKEEV